MNKNNNEDSSYIASLENSLKEKDKQIKKLEIEVSYLQNEVAQSKAVHEQSVSDDKEDGIFINGVLVDDETFAKISFINQA
jgi:uncharacterized protein (DUF3084 family)